MGVGPYLIEYQFEHVPQSAVRGQVLADFLAEHPSLEIELTEVAQQEIVTTKPWVLQFDGSVTYERSGAGLLIQSLTGKVFQFMICLEFQCTNNQAEYEALVQGLQLLKERDIDKVSVWGDSMLVIQQVKGEYQCRDPILQQYCTMVQNLSRRFTQIEFYHVYRTDNQQANNLAQMASGYKDIFDNDQSFDVIEVQKPAYVRLKSVLNIGVTVQTEDWREPIKQFLADPRPEAD